MYLVCYFWIGIANITKIGYLKRNSARRGFLALGLTGKLFFPEGKRKLDHPELDQVRSFLIT
jgi:hypothetical protein